jgi:hypothetical protein
MKDNNKSVTIQKSTGTSGGAVVVSDGSSKNSTVRYNPDALNASNDPDAKSSSQVLGDAMSLANDPG